MNLERKLMSLTPFHPGQANVKEILVHIWLKLRVASKLHGAGRDVEHGGVELLAFER